jgi:hypothetical protein
VSESITPETKARLVATTEASIAYTEQTLQAVVGMRRTFEARGVRFEDAVFNVIEFVLLLQFDLSCFFAELVRYTGSLRGNLYARQIIITIHESALTMRSLLARRFREQLVAASGAPGLDTELKGIHSSIQALFDRCNARFGDVRDGIVAHRDSDPAVRTRLVEAADQEDVAILAADLQEVLNRLLIPLLAYTSSLHQRLSPGEE